MISREAVPRLTDGNHRVTSPATAEYNCIAWAAEDTENWWQPGVYWPRESPPDDFGLEALVQAFLAIGCVPCGMDLGVEPGFVKVALFGSGFFYTHAARQLASGKWTSKLGRGEDIEHDHPDDVAGGLYGQVIMVMKRPVGSTP